MRIRTQGLMVAMEEEATETPVDEMENLENAVGADPGGTEDAVGAIDDLSIGIDDAVSDTETLGEISDVIEGSVESGEGLSPDAAKIAEIAVESIAARLGYPANIRPIPAMESFGSTSSRVTASRIALEGLGTMMKNAWEAIKKAFADMWKKIVEYYNKMFGEAERLNRIIKSVKTKVESIGAKNPTAKSVENSSVKSDFPSTGQVNATVVQEYLERHKDLLDATKSWGTEAVAAAKAISDSMDSIKKEKEKDKIADMLIDHMIKMSDAVVKVHGTGLSEKTVTVDGKTYTQLPIGPLVGGKIYAVSVDKGADTLKKPYLKFDEISAVKAGDVDRGPVAVLSVDEMKAILAASSGISDTMLSLRTTVGNVNKLNSGFDAAFNKAIKMAENEKDIDAEGVRVLKDIHRVCNQMGSATSRLMVMAPSQGFKAAKAALSYVTASAKLYKAA